MTMRQDILLIAVALGLIATALATPAQTGASEATREVAMTRHWGN